MLLTMMDVGSRQAFMARYDEFVREGWIIGTAWGLFSKAVPGFVGYQVPPLDPLASPL